IYIHQPASGEPCIVKVFLEPSASVDIGGNGALNGNFTTGNTSATNSPNIPNSMVPPSAAAGSLAAADSPQFLSNSQNDFKYAGTSDTACLVYAPESNVVMKGSATIYGAVVASDITISGNVQFHYDESLANAQIQESFPIYRVFSIVEIPAKAN